MLTAPAAFSMGKQMVHHYWDARLFPLHVLPEIALAKIREDAPSKKVCYIGCGVTTASGRSSIPQGRARRNVVVFGLGGIGLNVIQGARLVGANKIIGVDVNPRASACGTLGMTHFVTQEVGGDLVQHLVSLTDGGADYSFECVGNVDLMRQALECCTVAGACRSSSASRSGGGDQDPAVPAGHGSGVEGTAFGGARGRTDVPRIVDWYMDKKIKSTN